jgi:hypothetical protein
MSDFFPSFEGIKQDIASEIINFFHNEGRRYCSRRDDKTDPTRLRKTMVPPQVAIGLFA